MTILCMKETCKEKDINKYCVKIQKQFVICSKDKRQNKFLY